MTLEYRILHNSIRSQVLERDNNTCQRCETTDMPLEVHHIIPVRKGGTDELSNLISYCHKCHKIVEPPKSMGYNEKVSSGISLRISEEAHAKLTQEYKFGESLGDVLDRLLGIDMTNEIT